MYVLDTNVVSELRKLPGGRAHPSVARWAGERDLHECYLSAVTIKELDYGVLLVERRDPAQGEALRRWLTRVYEDFRERVLPVDEDVARCAARLHVPDPAPEADAYIAATVLASGFILATRNIADFRRFQGLKVVNPWDEGR